MRARASAKLLALFTAARASLVRCAQALGLSRRELQDWLMQTHWRLAGEGEALADDGLDLLPVLRAARQTSPQDFYWQLDWHLSTAGHRAVADALLRKVCVWFETNRCPNL